ncbi:MAG TPA: methyltransferase MtaB domain-containing protein [Bryobacteraceae bacterium]|nr:methyltransferase MtaB domain-containing protein [Bryobacteraceae bacterium]
MPYSRLAVSSPDELVFGTSLKPVTCGFELTIGGGLVYPEVNFTLPAIEVLAENWSQIVREYEEMADHIVRRAVALKTPGIVLEFELLPAMTETPEWGAEISALLKRHLTEAHQKHGLKSALRVTPTDIRDQKKPPELRSGMPWQNLMRSIALSIQAGADLISIESVGGKEVHDQALMYGDFRGIVFALGVLAPRDMAWLWGHIVESCRGTTAVPAGDTACAFANTAMQLAHQKMLPEVLAAVVRAMSAVRSLVAFESGAVGPSKDCAYEGPVIKAITGCPISMEGKTASCAHFSPVGNIAAAMCDLWSNESVQNVRLLSGNAPEAYTESLVYDCRLMNVAAGQGRARLMRDWLVTSDEWTSPQAAILSPEATCKIAQAIVSASGNYERTLAAGRAAVTILNDGVAKGRLQLGKKEAQWLSRIESELDSLPSSEVQALDEIGREHESLFDRASYGLADT